MNITQETIKRKIVDGFLYAARWSVGGTSRNYGRNLRWTKDARSKVEEVVEYFVKNCERDVELSAYDLSEVGHRLYFTTSGTGPTFSDHDTPELEEYAEGCPAYVARASGNNRHCRLDKDYMA